MRAVSNAVQTLTRPPASTDRGGLKSSGLHLRVVYAECGEPQVDTILPLMGGLVMGRAPGDGLELAGDAWASRRHAKISPAAGPVPMAKVEDLGSRNGTFVQGRRLEASTNALLGEVIRVGSTIFVLGCTEEPFETPPPRDFACRAPTMRDLWRRVQATAPSDVNVLLLGEMGTGKTRIARMIHELSARAGGPFLAHNCSAIPTNLEEATLFGVVGNFIPGVKAQDGLLTRAKGGTLFLDELADMPSLAQAKLLDAFDPSAPSYIAVGATKRLATDCRLISATNRDVFQLSSTGTLRQDLLSRLVVGQMTVPPLRERREDLLFIFLDALRRAGAEAVIPSAEVAEAMLLARWVENVRGLESLAQRVGLGERLSPQLIRSHADRGLGEPEVPAQWGQPRPGAPGFSAPPQPAWSTPAPANKTPIWPPTPEELLRLLNQHEWSVKEAAGAVGKRRETLSRLLRSTFGPGGRGAAQKAWRVLEACGRAPTGDHVEPVFKLFFERAEGAEVQAARVAWVQQGTPP